MKHLTLGLAPIVPVCADENPAKDTSGTNPTLLLRSVNLSNEYSELQSGNYLNNLSLKYTEPFMDGKMSMKLNVPMLWTDAGPGGSGLGDMSLKWTGVASIAKTDGWFINTERQHQPHLLVRLRHDPRNVLGETRRPRLQARRTGEETPANRRHDLQRKRVRQIRRCQVVQFRIARYQIRGAE